MVNEVKANQDVEVALERKAARNEFKKELTSLINRYSVENGSNTPDFILAGYLCKCLENYESTTRSTKEWHQPENAG